VGVNRKDIFEELIRNLPICIDALDAQGNIVFWNKECERITGYSQKEIIGNPDWMELLYPDSEYRNKLLNQWSKQGNNFRNWEMQLRAKDGAFKTISWSNLSDIFAIPGWHTWAIGVDVTSYVQEREKLSVREKQIRVLAEIQKDLQKAHTTEQIANTVLGHLESLMQAEGGLVLMYDFDHKQAEVISARFEHSIFYNAQNYIPLKQLIHIEDAKQGKVMYIEDLEIYSNVKLASLLIKKHGIKTAVLVPLIYADKAIGSLSLYAKRRFNVKPEDKEFLSQVGQLLALALYQNRLLEEVQNKIVALEQQTISQVSELKRNERRLRAQYESIPIPTYTWQKSGDDFILTDYNDMALATTYGKIGGLLGQKASEIYKNLPELGDLLRECYENEISIETQIKSTSLSREQPSYLSIKLAYVAPDSVLMHIEDITREFTAQQTIEQLQEITRRQNGTINLLHNDLSTISILFFPFLKDYLNEIREFKIKIADELNGEKSRLDFLTHNLEDYHQNLNKIVNFLQRYLYLHAALVKNDAINFADFVKAFMDAHAGLLKEFQTHIYLEAEEVFSDAGLLNEILSLLIKFIAGHKPSDRQPILRIISSKDEDGHFIITLKDNGQGLPKSTLSAQDETLLQIPVTMDDDFLSLLTIRRMVQQLSGKLRITSEKNEGTTIEIILPGDISHNEDDDA